MVTEGGEAMGEGSKRDGDTRHAEIYLGRAKALLQMARLLSGEVNP